MAELDLDALRRIVAKLRRIPELELTIDRLSSGEGVHEMATALALANQRAERMEAAARPFARCRTLRVEPPSGCGQCAGCNLRAALTASAEEGADDLNFHGRTMAEKATVPDDPIERFSVEEWLEKLNAAGAHLVVVGPFGAQVWGPHIGRWHEGRDRVEALARVYQDWTSDD